MKHDDEEECDTCQIIAQGGTVDDAECDSSERACGHHCAHSWSHDECCWCGQIWGDRDD